MFNYYLFIVTVVIAASSGLVQEKIGTVDANGVSFTFSNLEPKPTASGEYLESLRENAKEKPRMITREQEDKDLEENFVDMKTIKRGGKSGGAKFIEIKKDGTVIERHY